VTTDQKMPTRAEDIEQVNSWLARRPNDAPWLTINDALAIVRVLDVVRALERCPLCSGMRILPNFMDAPGGPRCACGRPSIHESGACDVEHDAVPCPRCGTFPCWKCRGKKLVEIVGHYPSSRGFIDTITCERCKGTGEESAHAE
jgi:hypothetical protein